MLAIYIVYRYIQFRLCPLRGTSEAAEKASLSEACLAKYTLRNANNQNKLWLYRGRPGVLCQHRGTGSACDFRPSSTDSMAACDLRHCATCCR
jgi:hypothetical protein